MSILNFSNIIIAVLIIVALWLILTFNGLVRRRYHVREAWSDIDVQLKRRHDLIPNLVESVKGYAGHEAGVFEKVSAARAAAMGATSKDDKDRAENALSGTLKTLFAVAENYPQLKANENFLQLQNELSDTENKIQAARRFYNGNVMDYNTKIATFPTDLMAGIFGFKKEEFFGTENAGEREPVQVKF